MSDYRSPSSRHLPEARFAPGTSFTDELLLDFVVEISYYSRAFDPDGKCVARVTLHCGEMALHPESGQEIALERLVSPALCEASPYQPLKLVMAIARRFHGSYFWVQIRVLVPEQKEAFNRKTNDWKTNDWKTTGSG